MKSHFATPERKSPQELHTEIEHINSSILMSRLLTSVNGILAILNPHRQIISVNTQFLEWCGVKNAQSLLGLRPGEVLECSYCHLEKGGCGTSEYCSTCGAAIAIVSSMEKKEAVEQICALKTEKDRQVQEMVLKVKAQPMELQGKTFQLLYLQDITRQQHRAALERSFFHDINNMLFGLAGASEMLGMENPHSQFLPMMEQALHRIRQEMDIQKQLLKSKDCTISTHWLPINVSLLLNELGQFFQQHPACRGKKLIIEEPEQGEEIISDRSLLFRILSNMITNALEASVEGDTVKLWVERDKSLSFKVWNRQSIPENVSLRIFQRNYSSKEGEGRGFGTYSMKLFGEQILGGKVRFTSSQEEGTLFQLSLPVSR